MHVLLLLLLSLLLYVLHVSLGTNILKVRDGMQFPRIEVPDNVVLQPIVFASKA